MRQKRPLSPVEELRREKLEKLEKCFTELETYKKNKLTKIMGVRCLNNQ